MKINKHILTILYVMEFCLNDRYLKYENEKFYMRMETNWKSYKIGDWKEISIRKKRTGYLDIHVGDKMYLVHRIIGYLFLKLDINDESQFIDHINHIRDDNRLENLRVVDRTGNAWNRSSDKGFHKFNDKYITRITVNKKRLWIGTFDTEEEARQAYLDAKSIHHIIQS